MCIQNWSRGCGRVSFFAVLFLLLASSRCLAAVYTVTSTADSGAGTLRQALTSANTNALLSSPGVQNINFALTTRPYTITLASALPAGLVPVIIDGTTQPGYVNKPIVELNGNNAAGAVGLNLGAGASTVRGLVLNRFASYAIELNGASNTVAGNWIGTDTNGLLSLGNQSYGIYATTSGNVIGGTNATDRNVISGNSLGIFLASPGGGNLVLGNWIGVNASNSLALANTNHGIQINGSAGNIIGGTNAGAANVISGNKGSGIYIYTTGASNNIILGNLIGTDSAGALAVSNSFDGVTINGLAGNVIGPGNVISGNGYSGVDLTGSTSSSNLVMGNWIGTDKTGLVALPNNVAGIALVAANANQIGGANAGAGNVISGNLQSGVELVSNAVHNVIQGNLIGVNAAGTGALSNGLDGIVLNGASSNLIGGTVSGARNIISGNASDGVCILQLTDTANQVQGNFIGTDITGAKALPNSNVGVLVQGCTNSIGGPAAGAQNVISGNAQQGVLLAGSAGSVPLGNIVQGNILGLDITGTNVLPNGNAGIGVSAAAKSQIGGAAAGARNIISGNNSYGLFVYGAQATNNVIQGNYIGPDRTGLRAVGNKYEGIYMEGGSSNQIGGTNAGAGNLISGNGTVGIWFTNTTLNVIQGNYIGTDATGTNNLANSAHNLDFEANASGNIVGGTNAGAGNRIAYAPDGFAGIRIRVGTQNILISGNSIWGNTGLGITLGVLYTEAPNQDCESGVAANAANASQNYPVITNVLCGPASTLIRGYLDSAMGASYRLQFFANPQVDPSGYGQGQFYLGATSLTLGAACTSNFMVLLPVTVPAGWSVSATATDPNNNTSEFSADALAVNPPPLRIAQTGASTHSVTNSKGMLTTYTVYTNTLVSYTNNDGPFTLQKTFSLTPPVNWINTTDAAVISNGNYTVVSPQGITNVFYRLTAP